MENRLFLKHFKVTHRFAILDTNINVHSVVVALTNYLYFCLCVRSIYTQDL